jgi:hypothetical protein
MKLELVLQDIELMDNSINDNTFNVYMDINTKLFHAFENDVKDGRHFEYCLVDTEENIVKHHRDEILHYCLSSISLTDSVSLGDIFLHGKFIKKL